MEYRRAVKILKAKIGLISNKEELIKFKKGEIADLATDFHKLKKMDFTSNLDGYFYIIDEDTEPRIQFDANRVVATGNFLKLEEEAKDNRFFLLGNEGLFYRFVLKILEDKFNIFSFHACSLFDEETGQLFIICGGAGSGKTAFILKGIEVGLKIFSTEMSHFNPHSPGRLKFYKGSLLDNIRIANLKYDYSKIYETLKLNLSEVEDEWGTKIAVDLSQYQTLFDQLDDPEIVLVFPHIEEEKKDSIVREVKNKSLLCKLLFDNLSEKIGETILLYEKVPVAGLDSSFSLRKRLEAVDEFIEYARLKRAIRVIAGTKNCLKGVKE